jgi:Na+-driven multidrug efflux pump
VFYAAVTLSASRLGVVQTAAHQILVRIYIFIILFAEPLGQFAQTMLPQAFVRQDVRSALQTTLKLVTASLVLGVVLATGFMAIPLGAAIFTSDLAVTTTLQSVAPVALFAASVMAPLSMYSMFLDHRYHNGGMIHHHQ